MNGWRYGVLAALAASVCAGSWAEAAKVKDVTVYREDGHFGGWPANNGIWVWGDEIVVGFTRGEMDYDKEDGHPIKRENSGPRQARSLDGGETWTIEMPSYLDADGKEKQPTECPGGIDFTHSSFAFMFRMEGSNEGYSRFYYSYDRCHTWNGPYALPGFDRKGIFARTDYIVEGKHEMLAFLTAAKDGGGEGWPFMARTTDGCKTWSFVSWIGEQPGEGGYSIMPSTVRLSSTDLLSMIRRRGELDGRRQWWLEPFLSTDNGASWKLIDEPFINNAGNPAHMIRLKDGRIALTFGYRLPPYGIRARISADNGKTWSSDIILRDDGGEWDLGYPRTVQRADGKIVTAYYFNDKAGESDKLQDRYIAATIWDPGAP